MEFTITFSTHLPPVILTPEANAFLERAFTCKHTHYCQDSIPVLGLPSLTDTLSVLVPGSDSRSDLRWGEAVTLEEILNFIIALTFCTF